MKRRSTIAFAGLFLALFAFSLAFAATKDNSAAARTTATRSASTLRPLANNVQLSIYIPPYGFPNPGGGEIGFWLGGGTTLGGSGTFPISTLSGPYYSYTTVSPGTYTLFITDPPGYSGPAIRYFQSVNGSSGPFTEVYPYGTVTITSGTNYFWADNTGTIVATR